MDGIRKEHDSPTKDKVIALVEAFLNKPRRESNGGYAEVKADDLLELNAIVRLLVKYRYEPDPDGDRPIRWSLCDVTREVPHHYSSLSRLKDDLSNINEVLEQAVRNLDRAHMALMHIYSLRK